MPQVCLTEYLAAVQVGELVSFPTDTVPALASQPEAGDRIYQLKQRSQTKPLILMAASLDDLQPYLAGTEVAITEWRQVAARYWPGALTLVLPASDRLPPAMNPENTGTLGIRVPDHPLARYLLERTGPLATTSVNRSGQPPLTTMAEINAQFPEIFTLSNVAVDELYRDLSEGTAPSADQPQGSGRPSTVIAWTGQGWKVLRQGTVMLG
jgi:L-threonylcarbamoyladenylate synthase